MNISKTWHSDITILPRTAVELARIIKASQPTVGSGHYSGQVPKGRRHVPSSDTTLTYASKGKGVILRKNMTGALVDVRA